MAAPNAADEISIILHIVRAQTGIDFSQYRETTIRRRLHRRVTACCCTDINEYANYLNSHPEEVGRLLGDITIKYTEFFRDPQVFESIESTVLPAVVEYRRQHGGTISAWSAGCATGEEAYSLTALICRAADFGTDFPPAQVLGTDIDPDTVLKARAGEWNGDCLPKPDLGDLFQSAGGRIRADGRLIGMTAFQVHNLLSQSAVEDMRAIHPETFDLILCRNVLIYLHRTAQRQILALCFELLRNGGFLVLGTGEIVPKNMQPGFAEIDSATRIYQKPF